jgi:hypothetical protein
VKAADQGEERAKHRLAAIQAASDGANPVSAAAKPRKKSNDKRSSEGKSEPVLTFFFFDDISNQHIEEKSKFLGIF